MKYFIIHYANPLLYLMFLPMFFASALIILTVVVLSEKALGNNKTALPKGYYKLTSWECEQEYA